MNIANCRLMGLALGPQMPPLDVKSVMNDEKMFAPLWHPLQRHTTSVAGPY